MRSEFTLPYLDYFQTSLSHQIGCTTVRICPPWIWQETQKINIVNINKCEISDKAFDLFHIRICSIWCMRLCVCVLVCVCLFAVGFHHKLVKTQQFYKLRCYNESHHCVFAHSSVSRMNWLKWKNRRWKQISMFHAFINSKNKTTKTGTVTYRL